MQVMHETILTVRHNKPTKRSIGTYKQTCNGQGKGRMQNAMVTLHPTVIARPTMRNFLAKFGMDFTC